MSVLIPGLHRDQSVWGADAEEFNPDHFSPENKPTIPPNAYKPFGFGMRSCIGRQFALQEATLVLGMLLQRFEFIDHRNYQLHTLTALTIKPQDLYIKIRLRADRNLVHRERAAAAATPVAQSAVGPAVAGHGTPLLVLFGSNLGTAEGIANKLAGEGTERGFQVTVGALDDHVGALPTAGAVVMVCCVLQRPATGKCGELRDLVARPRTAERCLRRCEVHRLRLRRHRLGRHLSGGADAA